MPTLREEQARLSTFAVTVLAAVAIGFVLWMMRPALVPFVLAVFIATLVAPIVDFQVLRWKWPRAIAVVNTLVVVLALVTALGYALILVGSAVVDEAAEYSDDARILAEKIVTRWRAMKTADDPAAEQDADGAAADNQTGADQPADGEGDSTEDALLLEFVDQLREPVMGIIQSAAGTAADVAAAILLTFIFVVMILSGRDPHFVHDGALAEIDAQVRTYLWIKTVISAATGVIVWLILWLLFELPYAYVFGILSFFLNYIPSIGSIIATLLPIPIAAAVPGAGFWYVAGVVAGPGAVQITVGTYIDPKLTGHGMKLHPICVLIALVAWGTLWGIPGMFLAVPLTAVVRILLLRFQSTQFAGQIMAGELPKSWNSAGHEQGK